MAEQTAAEVVREFLDDLVGRNVPPSESRRRDASKAFDEVRDAHDSLARAFNHVHEAHYVDGRLQDDCRTCRLDIRNAVHLSPAQLAARATA